MSARGSTAHASFRFDTLVNRPAAGLVPVGTRFFATDVQSEYVCAATSSGARYWKCVTSNQTDTALYVDGVLGSDANAGTPAAPLRTAAAAWNALPQASAGSCRINLVGAGPYALPPQVRGVQPVGPNGQPLVVVGDAFAQVATGTLSVVSGATATTSLGGAADAYRGLLFHNTTAGKTAQYYQIATSTAGPSAVLSSLGNAWGTAAPGDTFEVLQCATVLDATGAAFVGDGYLGFWRCKVTTGAGCTITDAPVVVFDACEMAQTGSLSLTSAPRLFLRPLPTVPGFASVTDVGTQSGAAGLWLHGGSAFAAVLGSQADGALVSGYLVSDGGVSVGGFGAGVRLEMSGTDIANATASVIGVFLANVSTFVQSSGWLRVALGGTGCVGVLANAGAVASLSTGVFTGCGQAALMSENEGGIIALGLSGSTGNGCGFFAFQGGWLVPSVSNSVTGSGGDVIIDGRAGLSLAVARLGGHVIRSTEGMPGAMLCWAGLLTGAAGAASAFFAMGGPPTAGNTSATALRYPVTPGRLARALRLTVLANAATSATTFTVFRAPLATGIPAATIIAASVGATTTGVFSDLSDSVTFNDGDQIDLQATNTAAGVGNNLTATASLQAA